jgi:hypothetical protein
MHVFLLTSFQVLSEADRCFVGFVSLNIQFGKLVQCDCFLIFNSFCPLGTLDRFLGFVHFFITVSHCSPHPWVLRFRTSSATVIVRSIAVELVQLVGLP